ncbi:MAG: thiamine phosphate synthase [Verrucomicrobiota bacterium JB022]|nr:thiamine phosphate synthase [Verrucomicrobiota bacterium JB022]
MKPIDYTLYLVTDAPDRYAAGLLEGVEAALEGGVTVVQYRSTTGTRRQLYDTCLALRQLTATYGVPLIVNDYLDLALAVEADGLHLGQNDLPVAVARRLLGPDRLLGLSITAPEQLDEVEPDLVDYLGLGPVFPTGSKDDAAPALGLEALRRLVARSPLPTVAIGGINTTNAPDVFATGVDGLAVVSALSYAQDPEAAARALLALK